MTVHCFTLLDSPLSGVFRYANSFWLPGNDSSIKYNFVLKSFITKVKCLGQNFQKEAVIFRDSSQHF